MRPVAIIQARMGSTRLPGKVLRPIVGQPMLWHIIQRVRGVPGLAEVVVATSDRPGDAPIRHFCRQHGIAYFAGSEYDVLDRFYRAAVRYEGDPLVRVTGDCPFVDPNLVGRLLELYGTGGYDHVAVAVGAGALLSEGGRFPDGLDAECFSFAALERSWHEATEASDREHVTPYMWRVPGRFRLGVLKTESDYYHLRWTVDNEADFQLVSLVYQGLYQEDRPFLMADVLRYLANHPEVVTLNESFVGQEGYRELWKLEDFLGEGKDA